MKNPKMDKIKKALAKHLTDQFGYCGVADGDNFAILNTGNGPEDFRIEIKDHSIVDAPAVTAEPKPEPGLGAMW